MKGFDRAQQQYRHALPEDGYRRFYGGGDEEDPDDARDRAEEDTFLRDQED